MTKESTTAGLGIFLRHSVSGKEGQALLAEHLYGPVFELNDEEEVSELKKECYPSLLGSKMVEEERTTGKKKMTKKVLAMCGPLSLVNHKDRASLRFTSPRTMLPQEEGREFHGLHAVYAQPTVGRFTRKAGQEIFACYANDVSFSS